MIDINHLDLFSGIGGFSYAAMLELGNSYRGCHSEIDKHAIKVYESHFKHKNLGDITKLDLNNLSNREFNLITFGSPCQDLSIARSNRAGLTGVKSRLFYAAVDVLDACNPKYFIMENVYSMPKTAKDNITKLLGVDPVMINSNNFTAQNRKRLYWTNIPFNKEKIPNYSVYMPNVIAWSRSTRYPKNADSYIESRERKDGNSNTLTTGKGCNSFSSKNYILDLEGSRLLTPKECEILQGYNGEHTKLVSDTQRYKLIGNSVTPQVIRHILKGVK